MNYSKSVKLILCLALSGSLFLANVSQSFAKPTNEIQEEIDALNSEISELDKQKEDAKKQKDEAQSQLNGVQGQIGSISGAMGDLGEEIEGLNQELVGLLLAIEMVEEDIAAKEKQIEETEIEYDNAVDQQNTQYESMKIRIRYMYEQGDSTYLSIFLEAQNNFADVINKVDYIEQLYTYDRHMLEKYIEAVNYTKSVWDKLEEERSELVTSKIELEEEQKMLEEIEAQLQAEYDNYSVMLAQAKQQAAVYSAKVNQQTNEIKKLEKEKKAKEAAAEEKKKEKAAEEKRIQEEEEAARAQAENRNDDSDSSNSNSGSKSNSSSSSGSSYTPSGSGTGSQIASYGLQFVGNPYVAGGTSLTDGADCSGFVQAVYKHFGYNLPRTSYSQSTVGRAVSYSEAQPGDIIYYGGHVGIYIGNGQIVHASTERTGIKVTAATYRSIITIRRVV